MLTLFLLAYLAGTLTIAAPCIFPILPFVLARTDVPFRRGALPMLLGLAFAFATVASLAAFAGGWAVAANRDARILALALLTLFGLAMIAPALARRLSAPAVAAGSRLLPRTTAAGSILVGVATGLVWAPCAGPVLGIILTGAALHGPGVGTSLLLLAYGLGAATSLAAGALFGGRVLALARHAVRWGDAARRLLGVTVVAAAVAIWLGLDAGALAGWSSAGTDTIERDLIAMLRNQPAPTIGMAAYAAESPSLSRPLRTLLGARQWLNAPPLRPEDVRGKVVLVNVWTYSCINCLRALPYVKAWADKYRNSGLVVVGVHTPEFAFEKDSDNVSKALAEYGIRYPVALDSDYAIWRGYDNEAWPAFYFIGADGQVRRRTYGEGGYDQSERLLQRLLSEAGGAPVAGDIAAVVGRGPEAAPDERDLRTAETYVGYAEATNFASPGGIREDASARYQAASALATGGWSLAGAWTVGSEFATLNVASGAIAFRFHARDLNLVMAPSAPGRPIRFRVSIDGAPPGASHGADTDAAGLGSLGDSRMYQLVRQAGPVADRTFEIEFQDPGVRAYSFTFG